jgi:A/G-specific adenine glycosylase
MLQRTRASQVEPVFLEFCRRYESPRDVVAAGRPAVDDIFSRLGLRWRADHFWRLQQALAERGGEPPHSLRELEDLPGVGTYAAAAVTVFAYGSSRTVVDANVLRVLGRYYGIEFDDGSRRRRGVLDWASEHAPAGAADCRKFNWALLDLGAEICTPSDPDCQICPLASKCQLGQERLRVLNGAVDGG